MRLGERAGLVKILIEQSNEGVISISCVLI